MAYLNYYLDLCAEAFIVYEGRVLLRLHDKYNIWAGPGGHIEPGEDANETVKREVWEEVGLKIELVGPKGWFKTDTKTNMDLVPPIFYNRHKINDHHDHACFIFAATSETDIVNPLTEADKGAKSIWVNQTELNEMSKADERLRPEVCRYAEMALNIAS